LYEDKGKAVTPEGRYKAEINDLHGDDHDYCDCLTSHMAFFENTPKNTHSMKLVEADDSEGVIKIKITLINVMVLKEYRTTNDNRIIDVSEYKYVSSSITISCTYNVANKLADNPKVQDEIDDVKKADSLWD